MKEYRFVAISDEYIKYLQNSEPHVMSNKIDERTYHRKYIGIIEELNGFKYFVQKGQCAKEKSLAKTKVKKWIDTEDLTINQKYILKWHNLIRTVGDKMIELKQSGRGEMLNEIAMYILNEFFVKDFVIEKNDDKSDSTDKSINGIYDVILTRIEAAYNVI